METTVARALLEFGMVSKQAYNCRPRLRFNKTRRILCILALVAVGMPDDERPVLRRSVEAVLNDLPRGEYTCATLLVCLDTL
eukprot:6898310-Alexandrium_andersonii.AAC.1